MPKPFMEHPEFVRVSAIISEFMVTLENRLLVDGMLSSNKLEHRTNRVCDDMTKLFLSAIDLRGKQVAAAEKATPPLPAIPHASDVEKQIVGKLVSDLLAVGFAITIDDGGGIEESPLRRSTDREAIFEALASTDSDRMYVCKNHEEPTVMYTGWVYLVWGNDVDVISDYTTNLEPHLAGANQLAEELDS